jgi:hypothetical protein
MCEDMAMLTGSFTVSGDASGPAYQSRKELKRAAWLQPLPYLPYSKPVEPELLDMSIYYVYVIFHPISALPCYIGKGCGQRMTTSANKHRNAFIKQYLTRTNSVLNYITGGGLQIKLVDAKSGFL